ncbi:MAG: hypothetical protein ACLGIC_08140 [Acidimicrobiia bacterium]
MTDMNQHICDQRYIHMTGSGGTGLTPGPRQSGECPDCHAAYWRPNAQAEWRPLGSYLSDDDEG